MKNLIKTITKNKYIKLLKKYKNLKREYKELYESRERLKVLNTELQKKNYEISYNNIDLLEQIKRYKRRNRQIREEKVELERMIGNENKKRIISKN